MFFSKIRNSTYGLNKLTLFFVAGLCLSIIVTCDYFGLLKYLDNQIARKVEYKVKDVLGVEQVIDPRIKVIIQDDKTVRRLGYKHLPTNVWSEIFREIDKQSPNVILINKMFSSPDTKDFNKTRFKEYVSKVRAKLVSALLTKNRGKDKLDIEGIGTHKEFDWKSYSDDKDMMDQVPEMTAKQLIGPHADIFSSTMYLGHPGIDVADLKVQPLLRKGDYVVPHLSLGVLDSVKVKDGFLVLNGEKSTLGLGDATRINLVNTKKWVFEKRIKSLWSVFRAIRNPDRDLSKVVSPGDIVLVLPDFYTGRQEFIPTPRGALPIGLIELNLVNTLLTKTWITEVVPRRLYLYVAAVLGLVFGVWFSAIGFISWTFLTVLLTFVAGSLLFSMNNVIIPWLSGNAVFVFCGLAVFTERTRLQESTNRKLKGALQGVVSPDRLKEILKNPSSLELEPASRLVSIMFIDIVGFSILAESQSPKDAFRHLKKILNLLTEAVHRHGGVVDKTLGDGLLCFFGYNYDGSASSTNHANEALACAMEIQRTVVKRSLEAKDTGEPVYPLRIGINSDEVYIGDLGDSRTIDFTLIGNGVNFAQRLEAACDPFSIMIGASCHDLISEDTVPSKHLTKRFIQIKHHDDYKEAWDCDPFVDDPPVRGRALAAYRDYAGIQRTDTRWSVPDGVYIRVDSHLGAGYLVNFSESGIAAKSPMFLAKGLQINLSVIFDREEFNERLREAGVRRVVAEVRWGRPVEGGYLHGFLIKNYDEHQKTQILDILRDAVSVDRGAA